MNGHKKVVVIIGSSSGIGRATAILCADRGYNLVLASRDGNEILDLTFECQKRGSKVLAIRADTSKPEEIDSLAQQTVAVFGGFDVWINDAAVAAYGRFEEVPLHCAQQVININVMGCIYGSRAALDHFKKQKSGTLINVSSVLGLLGQPFSSYYAMSKSAVRGLCLSLQSELASYKNIHVCCVMPAAMDTSFFRHAANFTGLAVKSSSPTLDANRVSRMFIKMMEKPKPEVFVGRNPWDLVLLRNFFPHFFEKMWLKHTLKHQFKNIPSASTEGNLFGPMKKAARDNGGWKRKRF
jgi:short-subunit dehydrogenase